MHALALTVRFALDGRVKPGHGVRWAGSSTSSQLLQVGGVGDTELTACLRSIAHHQG
jgi:hypothetical protein